MNSRKTKLADYYRIKFCLLLLSLIALGVMQPFWSYSDSHRGFDFLFMIVLLAATAAVSKKRHQFWIALVLALMSVGILSQDIWYDRKELGSDFRVLFLIAFLLYVLILILSDIVRAHVVTLDTIAGAVSVYLMIGTVYSLAFLYLERSCPGSFIEDGQPVAKTAFVEGETPDISAFQYLSFTTLTTLGYGDITPKSANARLLGTSEAIIGQLYLTVLIARLVGSMIVVRNKEEAP